MLEDPDGVEVMIGKIQVSEKVKQPWSAVSATDFDDRQHRKFAEKLKEFQSQNHFTSVH